LPPAEQYTLFLHDALPILKGVQCLDLGFNGRTGPLPILKSIECSLKGSRMILIGIYLKNICNCITGYNFGFFSREILAKNRVGIDRTSTRLNSSHVNISYA